MIAHSKHNDRDIDIITVEDIGADIGTYRSREQRKIFIKSFKSLYCLCRVDIYKVNENRQ